jgi:hypothetical protein
MSIPKEYHRAEAFGAADSDTNKVHLCKVAWCGEIKTLVWQEIEYIAALNLANHLNFILLEREANKELMK